MTPLILVHIASSILALFIAVSLLSTRALKPLCARILGVNYLLISAQNALAVLVFSGAWTHAALIRPFLAMVLGPTLFFYFRSALSSQDSEQDQLFWPHLLPVPICFGIALLLGGSALDYFILCSLFGYFSYTLLKCIQYWPKNTQVPDSNRLAFRWLGLLLCVMLINLCVDVGVLFELYSGIAVQESVSLTVGSIIFLGFHVLALVLVLTRAPLLEWMHDLKELSSPKSASQHLTEEELNAIYTKWEELVTEKELFLSENGITISRAGKPLGVPSRQLSQAINRIYGASFSQYLNDRRVDRAKELLQQEAEIPILDVYLTAGFGTKSHFHKEFSRCTGMTPTEYREKKKFI